MAHAALAVAALTLHVPDRARVFTPRLKLQASKSKRWLHQSSIYTPQIVDRNVVLEVNLSILLSCLAINCQCLINLYNGYISP